MTWTLDHGQLVRDGVPTLTLVRSTWGNGALPAATLDALADRIVDLLNAAESVPVATHDVNDRPLWGPCPVPGCPYMVRGDNQGLAGPEMHAEMHGWPHDFGMPCSCPACEAGYERPHRDDR